MNVPEYLHGHVAEQISIGTDAEIRRANWAVVLGLHPFRDGNEWCVLMGDDLQEGLVAFGKTPADAMWKFDQAFSGKATKPAESGGDK